MLNKILDAIEMYVTAILFAAMCVIILLQVIFRAIHLPLSWSEELARYLFVWITYLASSKAVRDGKHLCVDILPIILKGKAKIALHIVSTVLMMLFFAGLLYAGSLILPSMLVKTQYSPANHINMIIPYAAPTIGTILMVIRAVQVLAKDIRVLMNPEYKEAE